MPVAGDGWTFYWMPRTGGATLRQRLSDDGFPLEMLSPAHAWPGIFPIREGFSFTIQREQSAWERSWQELKDTNPQWSGDFLPDLLTMEWEEMTRRFAEGVDLVLRTEYLDEDYEELKRRLSGALRHAGKGT